MTDNQDQSFLRVMSFNIRLNHAADGENAWPSRKDIAASMLRFHRVDLAGLQEPLKEQVDDLTGRLPQFKGIGVGRDDGQEAGEFSLILYRPARLEPLQQATFWLSETPDLPGSTGWDARHSRIVTWAEFKDRQTGKTFFHFNTHFDNHGQQAREESARLLRAKVREIAGTQPIIVTGDFNCTETSETYGIVTGAADESQEAADTRLEDARYLSAHGHHGPTKTSNDQFEGKLTAKIDYIFVKDGVQVYQHGVLADHWDGRYPSDHLPVLAELFIE